MLESPDTKTTDTSPASDTASDTVSDGAQQTVQELRDLLQRLQGELKFKQTRIDALNFEVARLKRWRFGFSSESLDSSTQAVLFDHILADTALEDRAAQERSVCGLPNTLPSLFARQSYSADAVFNIDLRAVSVSEWGAG